MIFRFVLSVILVALVTGGSVVAGTVDENRELVSKFITAENTRDYRNLPTYIAEDFKRHSQATPNVEVANRDQYVAHMRDDDEFFAGAQYYVQQIIAEGDRVAVLASYRGQAASLGALTPSIDVDVSMFFRVEGNEIAELWTMWDNNALRSQLEGQLN